MTLDLEVTPQVSQRAHNRWLVHLGMILSFVAALGALVYFQGSTMHIFLGLVFVAFVCAHITQRRHTAVNMAAHLVRVRSWIKPRGRLAWSDLILAVLTLNVLVSGTVDWVVGHNTALPIQALTGLHIHFLGWHGFSGVVLFCYLLVHVLRRKKRLRTSHIR
jgi:hypothetical protein